MPDDVIRVQGLAALQRAFAKADKTVSKEFKGYLKSAAEPVAVQSEILALARIKNMTGPWAKTRIGVTRSLVYVAPKEKGRRSKRNIQIRRPNVKDLLLDRAMDPALTANSKQIGDTVGELLDKMATEWGSVGV